MAKKSTDTWMIAFPDDSRRVLHKTPDGNYYYYDTVDPADYVVGNKIKKTKLVTYKTSRGALAFSNKIFPKSPRHSAVNLEGIKENIHEGRIYAYRGEWNEKASR